MNSKVIEKTERDSDGFWVYLKPGFRAAKNNYEHLIHEDTRSAALSRLSEIVVCDCDECLKLINAETK